MGPRGIRTARPCRRQGKQSAQCNGDDRSQWLKQGGAVGAAFGFFKALPRGYGKISQRNPSLLLSARVPTSRNVYRGDFRFCRIVFVRCGVFYVQKPLADRAGLRTLKSDANRAGASMGMSSFSTCPFVETRYKKALSLIFALQIRESAFVLLTMRLLSQRIRSTPNSEKIIRQPSLFQHYALIGAQRVGGVGVVTQQFLGIGPAYGQGLGNFPLPQVAENQQLRLAVVPAIG